MSFKSLENVKMCGLFLFAWDTYAHYRISVWQKVVVKHCSVISYFFFSIVNTPFKLSLVCFMCLFVFIESSMIVFH